MSSYPRKAPLRNYLGLPDETIPRNQIKQIQASGKSLMPEGLEAGLTPQDLADLLECIERAEAR